MRAATVLVCLAVAYAQDYRGQAVPVTRPADPVEFSRARFLTLVFGREGPMDAPLRTAPVSGREYFVEADVFGIESAASIRFELADAAGRALQPLTLWKATDASSDGEFHGFVTVPAQPFRFAALGVGRNGAPFRSVLPDLFQPAANGPADSLPALVEDYRRRLQARAAQAAADHPGGVILLGRAVVSPIAYEPVALPAGGIIGMRLRYTLQVPAPRTIRAVPHVFPDYQTSSWRSVVTMSPIGGTIEPLPRMAGVQSVNDVLVYGADATYLPGVTYTFTIDMIPDYVYRGTQSGRYCIHEQRFASKRAVWDALIASPAAVPYSVTIYDTETFAAIPAFFPQRTFRESFIAAGAFDCGPVVNIRF